MATPGYGVPTPKKKTAPSGGTTAIQVPDYKAAIDAAAKTSFAPKPPVYRPVNRGEAGDIIRSEAANTAAGTNAQLDATAPPQDDYASLIAQLLGMPAASGGSGSGGGGKGGGGGGGLSAAAQSGMLDYLSYLQGRNTTQPFVDAAGRVDAAAATGRTSINDATAQLQAHVTAAQAAAQQQAQIRNAALAQLQAQYGQSTGNAFEQALTSLKSQGIGTGQLEAQQLGNQQGQGLMQQAQGGQTATLDAALQQYLGGQGVTAQMASAGGTQGLEDHRLALLAQIAQQRAAAEQAQQDEIAKFKLQLAQAGIQV